MRAILLTALLAACTPAPVPSPGPADPFAGAIVDCSTPEVVAESPGADGLVRVCLVEAGTSACLQQLLSTYRIDTVACVVRMQGEDANVRVLSRTGGADDTTVDASSRRWITQEQIGYR